MSSPYRSHPSKRPIPPEDEMKLILASGPLRARGWRLRLAALALGAIATGALLSASAEHGVGWGGAILIGLQCLVFPAAWLELYVRRARLVRSLERRGFDVPKELDGHADQ